MTQSIGHYSGLRPQMFLLFALISCLNIGQHQLVAAFRPTSDHFFANVRGPDNIKEPYDYPKYRRNLGIAQPAYDDQTDLGIVKPDSYYQDNIDYQDVDGDSRSILGGIANFIGGETAKKTVEGLGEIGKSVLNKVKPGLGDSIGSTLDTVNKITGTQDKPEEENESAAEAQSALASGPTSPYVQIIYQGEGAPKILSGNGVMRSGGVDYSKKIKKYKSLVRALKRKVKRLTKQLKSSRIGRLNDQSKLVDRATKRTKEDIIKDQDSA